MPSAAESSAAKASFGRQTSQRQPPGSSPERRARLNAVAVDRFRSDPTGKNSSIGRHPLILHFDINKTLIIADSIMNKSTEYTIREVIAHQFWGTRETKTDDRGTCKPVWRWDGVLKPQMEPTRPSDDGCEPGEGGKESEPMSYLQFCRTLDESKENIRLATRSFEYVNDPHVKKKMNELSDEAMQMMAIPQSSRSADLSQKTGLVGEWRLIFPSFFKLVAQLQRQRRQFAIFFRSFGTDLERVRAEWNSFCEMKHPLYNHLLEGVGPMDGTNAPVVPDRRLGEDGTHTMYRDADGPVLMLGSQTNGNWEGEWDQWSRSAAAEDTRNGRAFLKKQGWKSVQGYVNLQSWFEEQLRRSKSHILREDFAWWHWNKEVSTAGKLLIGIDRVQQVFFDDNIGTSSFRIVDPRASTNFMPKSVRKCLGAACIRVDALQAMVDENYFVQAFAKSERRPDVLWRDDVDSSAAGSEPDAPRPSIKQERGELSQFSSGFREESRSDGEDSSVHSSDVDEAEWNKGETLTITDIDNLRSILEAEGVSVDRFGAPGTTYKSLQNLHQELMDGKCCMKKVDTETGPRIMRSMQVMRVKLMCNNMILCETHEQLPDGRLRSRNGYLPASKVRQNESLDQVFDRWAAEELQLTVLEEQKRDALQSITHTHDVTEETMSYPLPCATHYVEVCCLLNPDMMNPVLLDRLGLPAGSMFSTRGVKKRGKSSEQTSMRFWSWYRAEVWEAMTRTSEVELPDVAGQMQQLFQGHPLRAAYEALLLQMFDLFHATKLCGGLSGSLVLQIQPVDPIEGRNEETVIVKLDKADVVSRELANSRRVWQALQDRAARVLGQGCFFTDSAATEYGAFKIELAGGCWQVPELAGASGSKDLLSTFKDLFSIESERQLLHTDMHHLVSTSGDIEVVLLELLGPGGMLRVLRRRGCRAAPTPC